MYNECEFRVQILIITKHLEVVPPYKICTQLVLVCSITMASILINSIFGHAC